MTFEEMILTYPEVIPSIFTWGAGLIFVPLLVFGLFAIADAITQAFHLRWLSARCYGLHTGFIKGFCHCHGCPHKGECMHYLDTRRITRWIRKLKAMKKEP